MALTEIARSAPPVEVAHLTDLSIDFEPVQLLTTPLGTRVTFVVRHGVVDGPMLRGEVLPGGGDWVLVGSDGVARLDVRATIRTDDGQLVQLTNTGRARLDDDARARFYDGQLVGWDEMYARSAPLFETGSEAHAWLNGAVTVAVNQFSLDHVDYRIYLVR